MPETHHETIALWLDEELRSVLAERPDLDVAFASDGDALQWRYLEGIEAGLAPHPERRTTFNLDFWHAMSHVHRAANAAHGEGTPEAKVQAADRRDDFPRRSLPQRFPVAVSTPAGGMIPTFRTVPVPAR